MNKIFITFFLFILNIVYAQTTVNWQFENPEKRQQFFKLLKEIRCVVCQNQSLADSDAKLAKDMQQIIYNQIKSGKSSKQVKNYLVKRYGEFVLYRPEFKSNNYLIWFFPIVIFIIGLILMIRINKTND